MNIAIRPIQSADDSAIANIIQSVGREFGAIGEGFGPSDAEVLAMSQHYNPEQKSQYWVATLNGEIIGCGGIAPFALSDSCCELRKLFILSQVRGYGIGKQLMNVALDTAREFGYTQCYLDTLANMQAAIALYEKFGFAHLDQPMEGTEHNGCDVWMLKQL